MSKSCAFCGAGLTRFLQDQLGHLLRDQPDLAVSGVFYVAYVAGIVLFAIGPALQSQSGATALVLGILLGVIAYGTCDMTNVATLRGWPVALSATDLVWGSALTGLSRRPATWPRAGRAPGPERGRRVAELAGELSPRVTREVFRMD